MGASSNGHDDARRTAVVVHSIPGRLRLRWPSGAAPPDVEAVRALPAVVDARWSSRTRSLLIVSRRQATDTAALTRAVAGVLRLDLSVRLSPEVPAARPTVAPALGPAVRTVTRGLDHAVGRATGGLLGLASLVPAALTVWALAEILRGHARPLRWSSALWYAHSLIRDYTVAGAE
jgi:hypothetical protein